MVYLQDQTSSELTYVIGERRVTPTRHTTNPRLQIQATV